MFIEIWHYLNLFIDGNLEKSLIGYLIFALVSTFLGLMIIIVDYCYYCLKRKSLLALEYKNSKKFPLMLVTYVIGAGFVGFFGVIGAILNFHVMGAMAAGVGWPTIFPRIIASVEAGVVEQKEEEE